MAGRQEQWRGIVCSDVIIAAGFAIFALSSFPPTQRFGLVVVSGTVIGILANLFLLPLLGGIERKTQRSPVSSYSERRGIRRYLIPFRNSGELWRGAGFRHTTQKAC